MKVSLESKAIKRNTRAEKKRRPTAISSRKYRTRKLVSKRERNAAGRIQRNS
jgi:hypothetical protein